MLLGLAIVHQPATALQRLWLELHMINPDKHTLDTRAIQQLHTLDTMHILHMPEHRLGMTMPRLDTGMEHLPVVALQVVTE